MLQLLQLLYPAFSTASPYDRIETSHRLGHFLISYVQFRDGCFQLVGELCEVLIATKTTDEIHSKRGLVANLTGEAKEVFHACTGSGGSLEFLNKAAQLLGCSSEHSSLLPKNIRILLNL